MASEVTKTLALVFGLVFSSLGCASTRLQLHIQNPQRQWIQAAYIDQGKVFLPGPEGGERVDALYDKGKDQFTFINHTNRFFLVLERENLQQLAGILSTVGLIRTTGGRSRFGKMYHQTDELRSINGFHCTVSQITRNGAPDTELCLAEPRSLKMQIEDYQTFKAMLAFTGEILEKAEQLPAKFMVSAPDLYAGKFDGFPVWLSRADKGMNIMLLKISEAPAAPKSFSIPSGYRQAGLVDFLQGQLDTINK